MSFMITPMRQMIKLEAGQTYTGYITLSVPRDAEEFHYVVSVLPYSIVGKEYRADFAFESDRTLLAKWITVDEPMGSLAPNGTKEIHYTIRVPDSVPDGGQYAAIAVSSNGRIGGGGNTNVQNIFEVASVLYADTSGETVHAGEILKNIVPGFSTTNDVKTEVDVSNTGNVHELVRTKIEVRNVITGEAVLMDDNEYDEIVMPDATRYISRKIDHLANLGVYDITQSVEYVNGEVNTVNQTLFIMPIWFIVLLILTVAAFIATIIRLVKRRYETKVELDAPHPLK